MANRRGVFIGVYVPASLKHDLSNAARTEFRTLSAEVERRLTISLYGAEKVAEQGEKRIGPRETRVEEVVCADSFRRHKFKERGRGRYANNCIRCGVPRLSAPAV
jgi:hypothetical protein